MKKNIFKKVLSVVLVMLLSVLLVGCIDAEPSKEIGEISSVAREEKSQTFGLNETAVFNTLKITANDDRATGRRFYIVVLFRS